MTNPMTIRTVAAFQTSDGTKFHDLGPAQDHTRELLIGDLYDRLCAHTPNYAKLDRALFVSAALRLGNAIGTVTKDKLEPVPFPDAAPKESVAAVEKPMPRANIPVADQNTTAMAKRFAPSVVIDEDALLAEMEITALEAENRTKA